MKKAERWQEELAGETSLQSIRTIQIDALYHARKLLRGQTAALADAALAVDIEEMWDANKS